jgi:hypothetical protein
MCLEIYQFSNILAFNHAKMPDNVVMEYPTLAKELALVAISTYQRHG